MDVLDVMLLAVAYTAIIAAIAVATPRVGDFIVSAVHRLTHHQAKTVK